MSKKLFAILSALLIIFILSGCQLAREYEVRNNSGDKLIGVYISYDYIFSSDEDDYFNDILYIYEDIMSIDLDTKKHEPRIYASLEEKTETSLDGEISTHKEFVFEDISGIAMFYPIIDDPLSEDMSYYSLTADGYTDVKTTMKSGDMEEELEISGTIYFSLDAVIDVIYINPVFQSEDGKVYLESGDGFALGNLGVTFSNELKNEITVSENDNIRSYISIIQVSIVNINPTNQISILEMDRDNKLVKKTDHNPDNILSVFNTESDTEYIIVESRKEVFNNESEIERRLFTKEDEELWYFKNHDDKVFVKAYTPILWE